MIVVQQRSFCVKGSQKVYAEELIRLLKSWNIERLIILCSSSLEGIPDEALMRLMFVIIYTTIILNAYPNSFLRMIV